MPEPSAPVPPCLLGASPAPLAIAGAESHTVVPIDAGAYRWLTTFLAAGQGGRGRLYLKLEHIRGSRDVTVLNAFVRLPAGATTPQPAWLLAGSESLFGLRMASLRQAGKSGAGLSALFDITPLLAELLHSPRTELSVRLVAVPVLPESAGLVVEGVSLYYVPDTR